MACIPLAAEVIIRLQFGCWCSTRVEVVVVVVVVLNSSTTTLTHYIHSRERARASEEGMIITNSNKDKSKCFCTILNKYGCVKVGVCVWKGCGACAERFMKVCVREKKYACVNFNYQTIKI